MINTNTALNELINLTLKTCEGWVKYNDNGELHYIDPIDKVEISAHYGATHAATAFVILGKSSNNQNLLNKGKDLLNSLLDRWDKNITLNGFHFDFNNFAVCLLYDYLEENSSLKEKIKQKICSTPDSNHYTINWLPMRWFVNKKRYEWTNDESFLQTINKCKNTIKQATNKDGGIEDILPKGKSFNLQYDLATVAVLQFLRCRDVDLDLSKELSFLLENIAPDGDINYQGRGTNQIFAWGLWVYLLKSSKKEKEVEKAITFLKDKVPTMLEQNNLMLNTIEGDEKYLWWDYHYSSVYITHFLFWLVLATIDDGKKPITTIKNKLSDTGVSITKTSDFFLATFNGRSKYLAEKGPIISCLWTKRHGTIFKGTFGPWQGLFGNKYTFGDVVMKNYFGLIKVSNNIDFTKNRFINKLLPNLKNKNYVQFSPLLAPFSFQETKTHLDIIFKNPKKQRVMLNLPILDSISNAIEIVLFVGTKKIRLVNNLKIKTQYGWSKIYQSYIMSDSLIVLRIII